MPAVRAIAGIVALSGILAASPTQARQSQCIVPELGLPLAGPDAVDCGVAPSHKKHARRRVANCARKAIAQGRPVRFGVGSMGTDAFDCDVIVLDKDGGSWLLSFDWDLSASGNSNPRVFVGRCPRIDLDWVDTEGRARFGPIKECRFDEDAFQRAKVRYP